MNTIGIILTSIERPALLQKSVDSIITNWQSNWTLFIGLQDNSDNKSFDIIAERILENPDKEIRLYNLEYNCGISKARNELIHHAALWNCDYVLLTADSIIFKDMDCLDTITHRMMYQKINLCGFNLEGRTPWEANLKLIPGQSFELDFIEPERKGLDFLIPCDIVRNFWIATTESLLNVPYDDNLIMCEHEDFFYRYKDFGYKVCCTNICNGLYETIENTPEYDKIRRINMWNGLKALKQKYNIKNWVSYKHLERTKL
jgi:glycosyltransferase involved in cell wall biosynthesis